MDIDASTLPPAEAAQVQMFAALVGSLPDDGLEFFIELLTKELAERRSSSDSGD
jgi:hypothetical protein